MSNMSLLQKVQQKKNEKDEKYHEAIVPVTTKVAKTVTVQIIEFNFFFGKTLFFHIPTAYVRATNGSSAFHQLAQQCSDVVVVGSKEAQLAPRCQ